MEEYRSQARKKAKLLPFVCENWNGEINALKKASQR